jgi:perosamine synthetase
MTRKFIPQMEPWFDYNEADALFSYMKSGGWVTEYKKTREFENEICIFTDSKHCIVVNNGTISLTLALLALGIQRGDEVLVPNLTMIATANASLLAGAKPIFTDICEDNLCMDLVDAENNITNNTKALIYVSFNGRTDNLFKVRDFCENNDLHLIEDAAQSLGSFNNNRHIGTFGKIGSFSFSTPKIITTGQGGALITDDDQMADSLRRLKDFGRIRGGIDIHDRIGYNFKFTDIQAVIGLEQMKKLNSRIKRKKEIYQKYVHELRSVEDIEFVPTNLSECCPWFVDTYVPDPDKLKSFLSGKNIGSRRIYPPISSQKAYNHFNINRLYPVSENFSSRGLWLPSSSKLSNKDIEYICYEIKQFYS